MSLEVFAVIGWSLAVISPFVLRAVFNWYDERHEDDGGHNDRT